MAPITASTEIARSPQEVFAYVDDVARHTEWQSGLQKVEILSGSGVGLRAKETRRVPGRSLTYTYEVTEHDPPTRMAFRVLDGAVRALGGMTVTPLEGGARSKVDFALDFEGHGFGKVLLGLVRRDARKTVPEDLARLKSRLEST
jgi:ribosome-associated toxin RatA of RatAB toxin-antitoxin module